jgi:Zn-dependent protease/CBS domain-containing protein
MGRKIPLLTLFGIPIQLDFSWLFVFVLVSWSLAVGFFPSFCADYHLSQTTLWIMGTVGALGLFTSIVFHELSHSLVAIKYGLPINRITLFIFGGVAEMSDEPSRPGVEFRMAVAGPLFSFGFSLLLFATQYFGKSRNWPVEVVSVLYYLAWVNSAVAIFNLIPAFPLDGGRVLRSILWQRKKNIVAATRTASKVGSIFGMVLMGLGVLSILGGNFVGGIWYFLIGMFLREAAQMSYNQVLIRKNLEGEKVKSFMNPHPISVSPSVNLDSWVSDYLMKYHFRAFPVVENDRLLGSISIHQLRGIPKSDWELHTVREYTQELSPLNTVSPEMEAKQAFGLMNSQGEGRLMVVDQGRLVGIITLSDILQYLSFMMEFDEPQKRAA